MAGFRDWLDLARSTILSLDSREVTGLYSLEWPEAVRVLTAEHRGAIESEKPGMRRWIRTGSAVVFGLTRRLAPARRLLFVAAFALFGLSLFRLLTDDIEPTFQTAVFLFGAFALMSFLLGVEIIDKLKFRDELVLARDLQAGLLPTHPPDFEGFELSAFNRIANTVGGDIYDFVPLSDGRLAILFGDASGHGMAAGLIMAVAHAAFRTQLEVDPSPRAMFTTLNRILCRTGSRRSFFAGVYMLLDRAGNFEVSVAGHPPVLQVDRSGGRTAVFGQGSYPLGIKDASVWALECGKLDVGDMLLFQSDGLTETRDRRGEFFGDDRVHASVQWSSGRSAADVLSSIVGHWRSFAGDMPVEDDVTVAVIRRAVDTSEAALDEHDGADAAAR